jgi:Icc-related predicted phosphoesterase
MPSEATETTPHGPGDLKVRIAAAGDIHCQESVRERIAAAFSAQDHAVDLILLAGDLTTHGEPAEASVLADACRGLSTPVLAVLGNHDWHADRHDEVVDALRGGGITLLDRSSTVFEVEGAEVGVVGAKGFVGGFPGSHLPDFGEPLMRRVYSEASYEVEALEQGLRAISMCPFRIVLLHYSPTLETLRGERPEIFAFLGTDRLAPPIIEHAPDIVLHGHAHAGTFQGSLGEVPVYNVSVPVMGQDFWVFELTGAARPGTPIH